MKALTSTVFTKMRRVICGWVAAAPVSIGSMNARGIQHYRHKADDPNSLISDNVFTIYGDRKGHMWVGQQHGISRFDPTTRGLLITSWIPIIRPAWQIGSRSCIKIISASWFGTFGGALVRFDDETKTFCDLPAPSTRLSQLNGGGLTSIDEDRTGTLWVGSFEDFTGSIGKTEPYSLHESQGLPSSTIRCIREDGVGRLRLSTQKGVSRFDPQKETFRNYDVSDGLQSNEFSDGCYQGRDGEMFFGGSNGFNAFFPENAATIPSCRR